MPRVIECSWALVALVLDITARAVFAAMFLRAVVLHCLIITILASYENQGLLSNIVDRSVYDGMQ